jgi:hypothetical protein
MIQARPVTGFNDPIYKKDMETVTAQICQYFGVTPDDLRSKTRKREVVIPRQMAMFFCKENNLGSLKSIGRFFGGRDHSTVIHAISTVEDDFYTNAKYKKTVEEVRELLNTKLDLRFKFFPPVNSPEVNANLESYKEVENQL